MKLQNLSQVDDSISGERDYNGSVSTLLPARRPVRDGVTVGVAS